MLSRRLIERGKVVDDVTNGDKRSHKSINVSVYFTVTFFLRVKNNLL